MKRTILFKAKRLDNSEWVEGYYVKKVAHKQTPKGDVVEDGEEHLIFGMTKTDVQPYWYEVDPSTVCQFTGLKDKDGKEVWEHDVLKCNNEVFEVVFKDGSFSISYWGGEEPLASFFINDVTLMTFTSLGSKFDRKEGEK